jgi:hypothetical protein
MHRDWTQGAGEGTHTDCGDALPWDWILTRARQIAGGALPTTYSNGGDMPWPLARTPRGISKPDGTWLPNEDVITLPGPAAGWRGREIVHVVFGWEGGYIQEAWWGPGGQHPVARMSDDRKSGGLTVGPFSPLVWEAPPGARFLVIRYAAPNGGSVAVETEH